LTALPWKRIHGGQSTEEHLLNRFEKWMLKRILHKLIRQGPHKHNITLMYKIIRIKAEQVFTEDNHPTLDAFLYECYQDSRR